MCAGELEVWCPQRRRQCESSLQSCSGAGCQWLSFGGLEGIAVFLSSVGRAMICFSGGNKLCYTNSAKMNKWSCRNPACSCALGSSGLAGHWVTALEQRCCCCDLALHLLCSSQKNLQKPWACWDLRCPCDWFINFKRPKYATHKTALSPRATLEYSLSLAQSALFWCCQHPTASLQAAVQSCKCGWELAALNSWTCFFCVAIALI